MTQKSKMYMMMLTDQRIKKRLLDLKSYGDSCSKILNLRDESLERR